MAHAKTTPDCHDAPEQLLARYVAGDAEAFERLVSLYEEKLYVFIVRMIGDDHLAEDVFQQVFIKVATKAESFDGRASFSTWLFRIARNAALDELRKRKRSPLVGTAEPDALATAVTVSPLDKMTGDELAERVREALAAIPADQREAFLLKEEAGLDFAEIGEILGCGRETAKSRFRLAVEKLRRLLNLEGGAA